MSRFYSYLNTSKKIIENFSGETPLAIYLKKYFNQEKKFGSKDRKQIASLVYNYYRIATGFSQNDDLETHLLLATFLCENMHNQVLANVKPDWNDNIEMPLLEKIKLTNLDFSIENIFPFQNELSKGVIKKDYEEAFLKQPKLFLRIRPGFDKIVLKKLADASTSFNLIDNDCLSFENNTKIDQIVEVGKEVIIQDYNSQQVGKAIKKYFEGLKVPINIWDCCAASGGKSIMINDFGLPINLHVSDIRESILENLQERFKLAGIKNHYTFIADLSKPINTDTKYDIIVADVPCTGSGTWVRTPEAKHYFKPEKLNFFEKLQFSIIENTATILKDNGLLIFITCSIFRQENEAQVEKITKQLGFELLEMDTLKGNELLADSMFFAVLKKK
jgi:16S rRNA (cytosine967-C5)-methyltransferase